MLAALEVLADVTADLVPRVTASSSIRRFEHLAEFGRLGPVYRIAYRIFGRREPACSKLGLNPLGGIWSQFHFHGISLFDL